MPSKTRETRRGLRHGFAAGAAALSAFALLFSGSAAAATTVGQSPPAVGSAFTCGPGVGLQISSSSGTPYIVPSPGGVITKWRSSATGTVALTIWTGSGTTWTPVAENEQTIAGVPTEFGVRIPVSGGEHIGRDASTKLSISGTRSASQRQRRSARRRRSRASGNTAST
jgi:hypothetical protein